MVTDKTEINIQLKDEFQLNQLESSYLFNVRVNNNTQNITDQNKPKAKAINLPIIGKWIPKYGIIDTLFGRWIL